jgi:predicted ester cyclase
MSREENERLIRLEVEFYNTQNWDIFDEIFAPNYFGHPPPGFHAGNLEQYKLASQAGFAAFSDIRLVLDDLLVDGDKAIKRWTITVKHTGELMGVPPTGKEITFSGINIFRIEDGKIVECWSQSDVLGMWQQIGTFPSMG